MNSQFYSDPNVTAGLTKTGGGTLSMTNISNNYSGPTHISGGTFYSTLGGNAGFGTGGAVTLESGAAIQFNGAPNVTNAGIFNGGTVSSNHGFGAIWAGAVTLNQNVTVNTAFHLNFSGIVSGTGGFIKTGADTMNLTAANTYTGTTTVNGGTLLINGTNSGAGAVTVASTATLGGTGAIGGNVTYAGGALARFTQGSPLAIAGTLTLNDNVVHLALPADLAGGTYTLATYLATGSTGSFNATPVIDSGSLATGATASVTTGSGFVKLVVSSGSDYDTWANGYPGYDLSNPAADTIGNGLTNGQKYAFGLNPTSFTDINPIKVTLDKTAGTFTYTRRATPATTNVVYTVWTSTDLGVWNQDTGAIEGTTTVTGEVETVPVTLSGAPFSDAKLFVRVKAALP